MTELTTPISDTRSFYSAGAGIDALQSAPADVPSALERLGPSPFPKAKFPFLGFLASVYDHVSSHARLRTGDQPPPPLG
ncbi:MAG TPA: hypothetical protein VFE58_13340 [Tepidisphaeraceae bacterium]|jgi:hypothetical protein|nr:hypothetical protein [Tepidisphaeraceae bacterium]